MNWRDSSNKVTTVSDTLSRSIRSRVKPRSPFLIRLRRKGEAPKKHFQILVQRQLSRANWSKATACFVFVIAATVYHVSPSPATTVMTMLINITLIAKFPTLAIWMASYGYFVHTIVVPDHSRLVFTVPIVLSLLVSNRNSTKKAEALRLQPGALALCCLLALVMLLSAIADPIIRRVEWVYIFSPINLCGCLLVARTIRSENDRRFSLLALSFTSMVLALYFSWYALGHDVTNRQQWEAAFEDAADPNYLAFYICIGFGPSLAGSFSRTTKSWWGRVISIVTSVIMLWGVLVTNSRMGSLLVGICIIAVLMSLNRSKVLSFVLVVVLAGVMIFVVYPIVGDVVPQMVALETRWSASDVASGSGRTEIARDALGAFARFTPVQVLVGGGAGANYVALGGRNTHNTYLEFLLDFGLVGLGGLIGLLSLAVVNVLRTPFSLNNVAMWSVWLTLAIASLVLSPFVRPLAWAALAPLLVAPPPILRTRTNSKWSSFIPLRRRVVWR